MKIKVLYSCIIVALCCSLHLAGQTQMPKWFIPGVMVDFTGANPSSSFFAPWGGSIYSLPPSNAAFDPAGNLLFAVTDFAIMDAATNVVSSLIGFPGREVAVFKVPGYCHRHYVVYGDGSTLYYTMVEDSPNGITVVPGQENVNCTGAGNFVGNLQIAVSKLNTTTQKRFLYVTSDVNLCKYTISKTGITYTSQLLNSSSGPGAGLNFASNELDLSHAGDKLSWGNWAGFFRDCNAFVVKLNASGNFVSLETYLLTNAGAWVGGTEFDATGNSLFVSTAWAGAGPPPSRGIHRIDLTLAPTTSLYLGASSCGGSQLEMAFDGKIYAEPNDGSNLIGVDPSNNSILTTTVNIASDQTLPDQVDGQDYTLSVGPPDFWVSDGMDSWNTIPDDGVEPRGMSWDGDIWNCENDPNCPENENPEFKLYGNNFMRVRVQNRGCEASVPTTADLHMYWTRGRSGEIWDGHWLDPILRPSNTISGNAAGGEITANQTTAVSIPIDIPAIPAGGSVILTQSWKPPHPSNFTGGPGPVDGNQNPMICFLARVESGIDPMYLEQYTGIADNVKNNNNIATRNTYLVDLNPINIFDWAGSIGINHTNVEDAMVHLEFSAAPLQSPFEGVGTIKLQLSPSLWEVWMASGARGENIEIIDDEKHIVQVLNPQYASLQGLNLNPDTEYSLLPGFGLNEGIQGEQFFQFRINMLDVNTGEYGSANTYDVRISEDCKINLLNEVSTTPGQCVTIGRDFGCRDCSYNWTPANGLSNPHGPITEACPSRTTTYLLSVVDESTGCESSDKVTVYVLEETGERAFTTIPTALLSAVKLFPNPADQRFQCSFEATEANAQNFVMTNSLGQIVLQNTLLAAKGENWFEFDVSQLPAGVYRVQIGEGLLTETLVIKR